MLIDVEISGIERSVDQSLDVESRGALLFFDHEARNLKMMPEFTGVDNLNLDIFDIGRTLTTYIEPRRFVRIRRIRTQW